MAVTLEILLLHRPNLLLPFTVYNKQSVPDVATGREDKEVKTPRGIESSLTSTEGLHNNSDDEDVADEVIPDLCACTNESSSGRTQRTLLEFDLGKGRFEGKDRMNGCVAPLTESGIGAIPTLDELRIAYEACPELGPIAKFLKIGDLPADDKLARIYNAKSGRLYSGGRRFVSSVCSKVPKYLARCCNYQKKPN